MILLNGQSGLEEDKGQTCCGGAKGTRAEGTEKNLKTKRTEEGGSFYSCNGGGESLGRTGYAGV